MFPFHYSGFLPKTVLQLFPMTVIISINLYLFTIFKWISIVFLIGYPFL